MKVKGLFVFPMPLRSKKDFKGIIFRVTDKKDISFDVECYDDSKPQRIRIKSKLEFWSNGKIHGGYSEATIDRLNICLTNIHSKIVAYINNNDFISKPLLMAFIYGGDFAQTSKKRRTQYITIPIEYQGNTVDSFELTSKEVKELIEPHFTKVTFTNSDGQPKTIEGIFDNETGESMIQSEDDFNEMVTTLKHDKDRHEEFRKLELERQNRTTAERYKLGEFNKNDICEVFALTYYDPTITNEFYTKIVIRIFEYKERTKVSTHVKDFNLEWIKGYFQWFEENGQYHINTSSFDPLKYNKAIFFKDKPRKPYKGKSVEKNVNMLKQVAEKLYKRKLLPKVEGLDEFTFEDVTKKKSRKGTRKELALNKEEFDTIFHHTIEKSNLPEYQKLYSEIEPKSRRVITVEELNHAKEMFIIQVMAGGLRGYHDLKTCEIRKHDNKTKKITFRAGKKDDALENPFNIYLEQVYKRNNNSLPLSINQEGLYASLIRTVVKFIGKTVKDFDRDVKPDKYVIEYFKVSDLFRQGYFSRKTFAQMLSKELGLSAENIQMFTGHEKEDNELVASYLDNNTIENKLKLISKLKIGKGLK